MPPLANSNPFGQETVTELENLQFLLTDTDHIPTPKNHTPTDILPRLTLENTGDRRDLATEKFDFLPENLPIGADTINATSRNIDELKRAAHKSDRKTGIGAVARRGFRNTPVFKSARRKSYWNQDNPNVFSSGDQQTKHR